MRREGDGGSCYSRTENEPALTVWPCLSSVAEPLITSSISVASIASGPLRRHDASDFKLLIISPLLHPPSRMLELLNELPPALQWPVHFMAGVTTICYVVSEITGNVSQVDRLWAILPFVYATYFTLLPLWPTSSFLGVFPYLPENAPTGLSADYSPRALLMLILTVRRFHARATGIANYDIVRVVRSFELQYVS